MHDVCALLSWRYPYYTYLEQRLDGGEVVEVMRLEAGEEERKALCESGVVRRVEPLLGEGGAQLERHLLQACFDLLGRRRACALGLGEWGVGLGAWGEGWIGVGRGGGAGLKAG